MVFLRKIAKYISFIVAVGIVVAAVTVCVSRLLTPIFAQHRADFEHFASELLHSPVTVATVNASWYHYTPEISLNDVTLLDAVTHKPVLHIDRLSVFISLSQSIWHWKFVVNGVMVSGSSIDIEKDKSGNIVIQGMKSLSSQVETNPTDIWAVLAWLTQEQQIILQNIDLHYTGINNEKRFVSLQELEVANNSTTHSINGIATLHQNLPTKIRMAMEWNGASFDLAKISAKAYFYISGLDLSQWLHAYSLRGWQIRKGIASNKVWLSWEKGALQKAQILAQLYGLELFSQNGNALHTIDRLSGSFGWKREGQTQTFAGEDILIDLPNKLWPVSSFYLSLLPDTNGDLQLQLIKLGYVNLPDIFEFLASGKALADKQIEALNKIKLTGVLQNVVITFPKTWNEWTELGFNASFNQLHFLAWNKLPGLTNLNGQIKWDGKQGALDLDSQQSNFTLKEYFANDIHFNQIKGQIQIQRVDNSVWHFITPKLQLINDDVNAVISGNVIMPENLVPIVELKSDFSVQHGEHVIHYLPLSTFDKSLTAWLKTAFISGVIENGHAELGGLLNKFPFNDASGIFKLTADVDHLNLKYAPDWPVLTNINAKLSFDADRCTIALKHAEILDNELKQVNAEIPSMMADKSYLKVSAPNQILDFARAVEVVRKSPLEASIGEIFKGKDFKGSITLGLQLNIPLADPNKTHVQGALQLQDNQMDLARTGLTINHLKGDLVFTEDSVNAKDLVATFFDKPLSVNLSTLKSVIQARFKTTVAMTDLEKWLHVPLTNMVQGTTDISGSLNFQLHKPFTLDVTSKLLGVSVTLPDKYGKPTNVTRNFNLAITAETDKPIKAQLNYANILSSAFVLSPKEQGYDLTAADLHIGNGVASFPESDGLYVTGNFDTLDLSQLQSKQTFVAPASLPLRNIDISTKIFKVGNLVLNNLNINVTPDKNDWLLALNSPDMDGQLRIPKNFNPQANIQASFSKLNIKPSDALQKSAEFNIKNFPAIDFSAKNLSYNNKSLGQVNLVTVPGPNGMIIKSFEISSSLMKLNASGKWKNSFTQIQGTLQSSRASALFKNFGIDAKNFILDSGTVTFNIFWNDAPYKFAIPNVNGSMKLNLGKGRIVDIGQQSGATMDLGRMLSIFSLQSIPRRLSFDFSDVFMKGYSFDKITGDLNLKSGNIYTSNFKFKGPVAMVGISGRIGLKDKDYDFTLIVTPYVTSSIPIAATLITMQPLIGLAAFAVNSVIGPTLNKATTYYYTVTGPWQNPVWKSVRVYQTAKR